MFSVICFQSDAGKMFVSANQNMFKNLLANWKSSLNLKTFLY